MAPELSGRHILFCNWRDTRNPEGGGSEVYVEHVAKGLIARGARVTIACATHDGAPPDEVVDGVRFMRRGSKLTVYAEVLTRLAMRRFGRVDAVIDVQNGLPFFTRLATRRPVVVLVHHVHKEQWPVVFPGTLGRVGWWIESGLAPWLYRHSQYVTVSQASREELERLGVDGSRITVVHNGSDPGPTGSAKTSTPTLCVVGRLVPHKQVEHAIDAVAELSKDLPGLTMDVVGSGWWKDQLTAHAARLGVTHRVRFRGFLSEAAKHSVYARSWVMALPSMKEGWGLVVAEGGAHSTPTVAYRDAGGTRESIDDGVSGLLVDTPDGFTRGLRELLTDGELRRHLGDGARKRAHSYTWGHAQQSFATVLDHVLHGERVTGTDPDDVG
jgi:glycosyltransferase involved in cell wall biosynthesis